MSSVRWCFLCPAFIQLMAFPAKKNSQLQSPSGASANGHIIYRKTILHNTPVLKSTPAITPFIKNTSHNTPVLKGIPENTQELQNSDVVQISIWANTTVTSSTRPTLSNPTPPTASSMITSWKGVDPRVYDVSCEETVCPTNSFCSNDYNSGGSRCHCNLGHHGDLCSEGDMLTNKLILYNSGSVICLCERYWYVDVLVCQYRCLNSLSKVLRIFSHDIWTPKEFIPELPYHFGVQGEIPKTDTTEFNLSVSLSLTVSL